MPASRLRRCATLAAFLLAPIGAAHAADWTIDTAHSTLGFSGTQTGKPFSGHFKTFSGAIAFDPAHPETGHATITIQTASATTGDTQRDTAMPGADWFNTALFPAATFVADRFEAHGQNAFIAHGMLTIRGVSHAETLPFTLDITGASAHARGHLDITRDVFGVGQGPWASGQWVGLSVGVDFDLIATKAP